MSGASLLIIEPHSNYHVINCPDCVFFYGDFLNGRKHGVGSCYDKYGNLIYYGEFKDNMPVVNYPSKDELTMYKFEIIEYSNYGIYIGETIHGKLEGIGMIIEESGDIWYGHFKNNMFDGYGVHFNKYGSYTEGIWKENKLIQKLQ
jgi:hypothetical protein